MAKLGESMNAQGGNAVRNMPEKAAQNFGSAVESASHRLGTRLGTVAGDVSEKASDYVDTTRTYVKEHPIQSIAAAAAAGVVVGSLVSMFRGRK